MNWTTALIERSLAFDQPVERVYAHWISPTARQRWEAGPDTGMAYDAFDTRTGGTEVVRVIHEGTEVGHMVQRHARVDENALIATQIEGIFGGACTMLMTVVIEFLQTETGCRLNAVAQVVDLTGADVQAQHEAGWDWLLDRFVTDLKDHG